VGSAPLDPSIADPALRNADATNAVWAQWDDDPTLVHARWDEIGVGEVECGDASGDVCDSIRQPGSGHTISLSPGGPWYVPEIGPFLRHHLALAG
jgi:hypothetical protein